MQKVPKKIISAKRLTFFDMSGSYQNFCQQYNEKSKTSDLSLKSHPVNARFKLVSPKAFNIGRI